MILTSPLSLFYSEEAEAQRGRTICPMFHSQEEPGLQLRAPGADPCALSQHPCIAGIYLPPSCLLSHGLYSVCWPQALG